MATGTIQVNVMTSRGKIPVEDATVLLVRQEINGKEKVIALEVTNFSGQTRQIAFPTPSEDKSTAPEEGVGYALVDVWVEHPDFVTQKIEGVQIFPDTDTILPVELYPLAEGESSLVGEEQTDLSAQDL